MKTRITFIGDDYWTAHLAALLDERFPDTVTCVAVRLRENPRAARQAIPRLVRDDVIVRVGFPPPSLPAYDEGQCAHRTGWRETVKRRLFRTSIGRSLRALVLFTRLDSLWRSMFTVDWLQRVTSHLRPQRRDVLYWIGSDVTTVLDAHGHRADNSIPVTLARYRHFSVAPHLIRELEPIVNQVSLVHFPKPLPKVPDPLPPMPVRFRVLTYLPNQRFDFYGGATVLGAAKLLPGVRFSVFGGEKPEDREVPGNVEFLGYVFDREGLYADCSVFVRLTQHDGSPSTVAEALCMGRYVIHSFPHPHCVLVNPNDVLGLTRALEVLQAAQESGRLHPDSEAAAWAMREYDPGRCLLELHRLLTC